MLTVKRLHVSTPAVVMVGLLCVGGCATPPSPASKEVAPPPKKSVPPPISSPAHMKLRSLMIEAEKRLLLCGQEGPCDRLHFMTGLSALETNPDAAAAHFREVVRTSPKSSIASLSRSWLNALAASSSLEDKQVIMETTEWLFTELLNRDKQVDELSKQVEELSKQLNALKLVDLEMKERTSRMKPRITPLPKLESAP